MSGRRVVVARRISQVSALLIVILSASPAQEAVSPEARLKALGIELPPPPTPLASYIPAVRSGNLVFLAGQGPKAGGNVTITGKVGAELTEEQGYQAARTTILVSLAALRAEIGSLDSVRRIVKLLGFVNSAPGFTRQPWVINGASDLLIEIFGESGRHARSAVGTNELPLNIPVEIEMIVEVAPGSTPDGFQVRHTMSVSAPAATVYETLVDDIGRWWNSDHTYTGDSKNLSIDARPGGCFCESFPEGGGVEHLRVVYAAPGSVLRMSGGLGPLQSYGVAGSLTWTLTAAGESTSVELIYLVGGYIEGGFEQLEPAVGGVLLEQMRRLKSFVETGSPVEAKGR